MVNKNFKIEHFLSLTFHIIIDSFATNSFHNMNAGVCNIQYANVVNQLYDILHIWIIKYSTQVK